jgi:protein involved in polysaccharide export with SLBB domain
MLRTVDRNGQIFLPKVGDVRIWGLTFAQADRLIREQMSRYFRGFQTSVTMGRLRTVRVQVIGEVCQPGSYTLNSLATLTQALYAAGGATKLGSLRSVRLLRNSHVVGEIDLYDFLLRGDRTRDFRLESGDTVFVPTIGDVAAIAGEVKRPAIYEIKADVRLADVVEAAGGATPSSYLKRVQIVRAQPNAERVTVDVDLSQYYLKGDMQANPPVHAGDLVLVHKNDSRIYNTVKVEGAVKYPGVYELKPMMRLSQLVTQDSVLPESYTERVEIARRRPDYSVEVLWVNLQKAWTGDRDQDPLLKASDEVMVRTEKRETRTVTLAGEVQRPGVYVIAEGERLSSVLQRAGGFTARAYLKGAVFTRASLRKVEQEQLNAFVRVQEQRILAEASTAVAGAEKDEAAVSASIVQARRDFLRALASRVALGRVVLKLAPPEQLKNSPEDVVLTDGDSLEVPEPVDSVLVLGSVRNSTSVLHSPGAGVDYYVNRVGGYAKEADKKEVHIVRADGSAVSGFSNIRTVEPGDTIVVPRDEESKIRVIPAIRDGFSIMGSALSGVLSLAALAVLF